MTIARLVIITSGIILLSACKPQAVSPYMIDLDEGTFTFKEHGHLYGPQWVEINGFNALQKGHLFRGSDSLVVISSRGGLDVITVFKGAEDQASMLIWVHNPTDSARGISSLNVESQLFSCQTGESDPLWQWKDRDSAESPGCSLMLSGSSIVLLPGEGIMLPPLRFFSHLCSQ